MATWKKILHTGNVISTDLATEGSDGHVLTTNGAGVVSWAEAGGGAFTVSGNDASYTAGNVGIGTASPTSLLDIAGSADDSSINIRTQDDTVETQYEGARVRFAKSGNGFLGHVGYRYYNATNRGLELYSVNDVNFKVNSTDTNVLTIKSTGLIGIGTDSPTTTLDISDNGTQLVGNLNYTILARHSSMSRGVVLGHDGGAAAGFISAYGASNDLIFATHNGTAYGERMRLDHDGNLAIGKSDSVMSELSDTNTKLTIYNSSYAGVLELGGDISTNGGLVGSIWFSNENNADDTNVDSDTKLVGTIDVRSKTSDSNADDDSGSYMVFKTKAEAAALTEAMRIDSTGKVGIGTTNPTVDLHVAGSVKVDNNLTVDGNTTLAGVVTINSTTVTIDDKQILMAEGSDTSTSIGAALQVDTGQTAVSQLEYEGITPTYGAGWKIIVGNAGTGAADFITSRTNHIMAFRTGAGAPTGVTNAVGKGNFYYDTSNDQLYMCTAT